MVSYRFDLYPRDDPKDGTLVRSLVPESTDEVLTGGLQKAAYRAEANGASTGKLAVRSTSLAGQAIDPAGLQYVRVVELPGGSVRGGFFLEKGKFSALSEEEDSLLEFSGSGTLSYLSRAVMAPHTYISPIFTGQDPIAGVWNLWNQSTVFANGNYLGAMLWRVIYEATHFTPGTHRHADGADYTDTHDDDRLENPLPALTMGFDAFEDSSGNPWTISSGEFKAQVGENVLTVVHRLMEAGLYVELDPDTFVLNAWEQDVHRAARDATGSAWATGVVRFQAPTDPDDITTGNIKDDAKRDIRAFIKRSALWAGGNAFYGFSTAGSDIPWEGFYRTDMVDTAALSAVAAEQLRAIGESGDNLKLRLWMEDDPENGRYLPFEHVQLNQEVTVHTGSGQWEFNEASYPVAAMNLQLRQGGGWDCIVELGGSYLTMPGPIGGGPIPPAGSGGIVGNCLIDNSSLKWESDNAAQQSYKAFDCDDSTWYGSLSPSVAAQYLARDYGVAVTASQWRLLHDVAEPTLTASSMKIFGTNSDAVWATVASGTGYDFAANGWTEVVDVALAAGDNSGTFAAASYRYWAWKPAGSAVNGWKVYTIELSTGADTPVGGPGADPGTPGTYAPFDHDHDAVYNGDAAGGDLSGTYPDPTVPHITEAADAHDASAITFMPAGSIAATDVQSAIEEVASEAGGSSLTIEDEGTPLATAATTLDFVGAGVTATGSGAEKTITIPGGGSGVTVEEDDGTPTLTATKIVFDNGTVTDEGSGVARVTNSGGGGGGTVYPYTDMDEPPASPHASNMEGGTGAMSGWTWLTSSGTVTNASGIIEQMFADDSGPAAPIWNVNDDIADHLVFQPLNAGKLAAYLGFAPSSGTDWVVAAKFHILTANNESGSDDRIMFGVTSDATPSIASNEVANSIAAELRTNTLSFTHALIRPGVRAASTATNQGTMYAAISGRADNSIVVYAGFNGMWWRKKGRIASGTAPAGAGTVQNVFIYLQDLNNSGQASAAIVDWIRFKEGVTSPFALGGGR